MESLLKQLTFPCISCPKHPRNELQMINLLPEQDEPLCLSCVFTQQLKSENVETIFSMLSQLEDFDKKVLEMSLRVKETLPDDIVTLRDNKETVISELGAFAEV